MGSICNVKPMGVNRVLPDKLMESESCHDLVQCAFSLSEFDLEVYQKLHESGPIRADELAEIIGRDRSTVYRSLKKLLSCGLCNRETKSLEKGGYYHLYGAVSKKKVKAKLEECISEWHEKMLNALSTFEEEI